MPVHTSTQLRSRADQIDILLAFADRLREHEKLNEQNVVVSDQPVPLQFPAGGFCVCVAPGDGRFPDNLWEGGHHATGTESGSVIVGIYTQIRRDRPGRREQAMLGRKSIPGSEPSMERPSLLIWKRDILSLLTVQDPSRKAASQAWEPSKDCAPLCRSIPRPIRATSALDVPGHDGWIGMQITWAVEWDWDLYV